MITVLLRVTHGPEAIAVTLSALVPAVAAGLVADAVILTTAQDDGIDEVAEAAGAGVVIAPAGSWAEGAGRARHDWLLCLADGDLPQEGWIRALDRFVGLAGERQDRARFKRRQGLVKATGDLLFRLFKPSAIRAGDLVHKRIVLGEKKGGMPVRLQVSIERDAAFS